jgi:hypothetical protein
MKKSIALFMTMIVLGLTTGAEAQIRVPAEEPLVNQYVSDGYVQRTQSWWNLLGRQLTYSLDKSYEDISARELQNIVFFAYHHGEKVHLLDSIPTLMDIYRHHENEQFRIMAVAALDAIGDKAALKELQRLVKQEPSKRVQKITRAALKKVK